MAAIPFEKGFEATLIQTWSYTEKIMPKQRQLTIFYVETPDFNNTITPSLGG